MQVYGKATINADITGDSKLECGIGGIDINLTRSEECYKIKGETGIRKF